MVQLCLGSANFGSKYGLDNKKIDNKKLSKILNEAFKSKLHNIDTSFEYVNSHHNLKKLIKKKNDYKFKNFFKAEIKFYACKKKN